MHFKKLSLGILFLLIVFYRAEALPSFNSGEESVISRVLALDELRLALIKEEAFTYEYVLYGHTSVYSNSYSYSTPRFFIIIKQSQDDEEGRKIERSFIASYNMSTIQADHGLQQQWTGLSFARLKNKIKESFPAEEFFSELSEKNLVESLSGFRKVSLLEFLPKELQEKYSKAYFITRPYLASEGMHRSSSSGMYSGVSRFILVQEKASDIWKRAKYDDLDLASVFKDSSKDARKAYEICKEQLKLNENFNARSLRRLVARHWFSKLSHLPPPSDDLSLYKEAVGEFCNESYN